MAAQTDRDWRRHAAGALRSSRILAWPLRHPGALFLLLVCILLVFAAADYAEARWLARLSTPYPGLAQIIQAISCLMICLLLLAWVMSGASPSPLPMESSAEDWLRGAWPQEQEWLRTFAGWFILVRWVAIAVVSIMTVVVVYIARLLVPEVAPLLMLTIAALAISNLAYRLLLHRCGGRKYFLLLQLHGDLLFFVLLLHLSGGIENPLSLLMVLHVIIGGAALGRRQCYGVAAVATILLSFLSVAEWQDWITHRGTLVSLASVGNAGTFHPSHAGLHVLSLVTLHGVIFFVTAFFVSALAERVRYDERQLATVAARAIAARQLLERALETTGTGLRVLDAHLRPYWCNGEWLRWFTADHPADAIAARTLGTRQVQMTEKIVPSPPSNEQPPHSARSHERVLQLTTAFLLAENGQIGQVVELFQDITMQKEMQAQAIRAGKLAAVGELAGHVAHEVNNPITIISAKVRLLLQDHADEIPPLVARELRKIIEQSDRVARIAQGLLSYCRPSTGFRSPLSIHRPVRNALGIVEQRARSQQVRIDDQVPETLPPVVANDGEMQQVFLNLFLNALDAMPSGGMLGILGRQLNGCVEVVVSDSGPGVAPEVCGRIFEPFVTTKEEGRGTGLGLSICLGLVRSHDGEITVESERGQGSRFSVKLPTVVPCLELRE